MNASTSFIDQLRQDFHSNPIDMQVILPDGSHAIVKEVKDIDGVTTYRVQKCTQTGRYIATPHKTAWFIIDDLRLFFWSAGINPDWNRA